MILPPFELHAPKTVEEAVALKVRFGKSADLIAGGTDLLCNYKYELNPKPHMISLRDVEELQSFDTRRIGAAAILDDVKDDAAFRHELPVIPEAILTISSHLLRQTGTVGGNLLVDTRCFWFNQSRFWRESIGSCLKAEGDVCRVVLGREGVRRRVLGRSRAGADHARVLGDGRGPEGPPHRPARPLLPA